MTGTARMRTTAALVCAALAVLPAVAQGAAPSGDPPSAEARGPEWFRWQSPDKVLRLLSIREGETLAQIGADTSAFAPMLATSAGLEGKVYALVSDPAAVGRLDSEYVARLQNLETRVMDGETLPLEEASVDLVLAVNRWHRLADRGAMAEQVRRALKIGGRLVIIDWHGEEMPLAPPVEQRLPRETLIREMTEAGWSWTSESHALEYQYFLVFTSQP